MHLNLRSTATIRAIETSNGAKTVSFKTPDYNGVMGWEQFPVSSFDFVEVEKVLQSNFENFHNLSKIDSVSGIEMIVTYNRNK